MTPENQQIFLTIEPVLAEAGISWSELILANYADAKRYRRRMTQIILARHDRRLEGCVVIRFDETARLEAARRAAASFFVELDPMLIEPDPIQITMDPFRIELDALSAAGTLRRSLRSDPFPPRAFLGFREKLRHWSHHFVRILNRICVRQIMTQFSRLEGLRNHRPSPRRSYATDNSRRAGCARRLGRRRGCGRRR